MGRVFVSYSHADATWLERLRVHLKPLERQGLVELWADTRIATGDIWRAEIEQAMTSAQVAVLLVSADFLASDFIAANELPPLLQRAEDDGLAIMPLILSPCLFEQTPSISCFQAVNPASQPLSAMSRARRDKVFVKLSLDIVAALQRGAATAAGSNRSAGSSAGSRRCFRVPRRRAGQVHRVDDIAARPEAAVAYLARRVCPLHAARRLCHTALT